MSQLVGHRSWLATERPILRSCAPSAARTITTPRQGQAPGNPTWTQGKHRSFTEHALNAPLHFMSLRHLLCLAICHKMPRLRLSSRPNLVYEISGLQRTEQQASTRTDGAGLAALQMQQYTLQGECGPNWMPAHCISALLLFVARPVNELLGVAGGQNLCSTRGGQQRGSA